MVALLLIFISTVTRILLLGKSATDFDFTISNLLGVFTIGLFYDVVNAAYFCIPLALYFWFVPRTIFNKPWHRYLIYILFFIFTTILLFNAAAEWLFWDEFNTRFNFIAVDYLVYTTEVIGNIEQSYPVYWILSAVIGAALVIIIALKPKINSYQNDNLSFLKRTKLMALYITILTVIFISVSSTQHHFSTNAYANELAGNGMYELFAAYRNNELDYERFYKHINKEKDFKLFHELIKTPEAEFSPADSLGLIRTIISPLPEKRMNVVLISVESLSADFMKLFGNNENMTPFLDSLAQHSLVFTNLYATGTRTVRGLEALSLAVPPVPGQSIVRRPNNENLFSLGRVFNEKGYKSKFIYGGYGYFDNMNYFFQHNGYQAIDRSSLRSEEIDYENIWGVADENLFTLALREIDETTDEHPVFAHIMTTSNHRPFTYPEGRIDIPSHTNRKGAVKYTDYAIGKFIKEASAKKWFNNTLFVIVADHCASSAGKTELPVNKYHIPMLVYSPGYIEPAVMNRLMSQIDVCPTLLGLLNFSYTTKFLGYDIFKLEPGRERAFISTYQNLGFIKGNNLVILSPQQKVETFVLDENLNPRPQALDESVVTEAITWYQTASYTFKNNLMR
ncbi:MAG: sulfatase-like hydrolase/transferase [Cyclobacteriaceae bacterium]|nr:sulfatase-like hydrolase/transferase [Cyclobacteriaceae bacterium]UYN88216.1 MAG: sulfatase-like hydrolase/transferase [Cyclobacteriaceae bacterium]